MFLVWYFNLLNDRTEMLLSIFLRILNRGECIFFFFQAEDGIRDVAVTGVQTCALPIYGDVSVNVSTHVCVHLKQDLHM